VTSLFAPLLIVTGVLVVAGIAKLIRPSPTATALRALKIPKPLVAARLLGTAEVALGISAAMIGQSVLWAGVAVAYTVFTLFIFWALSGNEDVGSCGCFGQEDTPPTPGHAAFNAAGAALAALAIVNPVSISDFDGTSTEALVATVLILTGIALSVAALTHLPRVLALVHGTATPTTPTFSLDRNAVSATTSRGPT